MLDSKKLKAYVDISIDMSWYQSDGYKTAHRVNNGIQTISDTIDSMPKLIESMMAAEAYMSSGVVSQDAKDKFQASKDQIYDLFSKSISSIAVVMDD